MIQLLSKIVGYALFLIVAILFINYLYFIFGGVVLFLTCIIYAYFAARKLQPSQVIIIGMIFYTFIVVIWVYNFWIRTYIEDLKTTQFCKIICTENEIITIGIALLVVSLIWGFIGIKVGLLLFRKHKK